MDVKDAIAKVSKDNNIDMAEEMDTFLFREETKQVYLYGLYTVKDLKLLIDVFTLMEKK